MIITAPRLHGRISFNVDDGAGTNECQHLQHHDHPVNDNDRRSPVTRRLHGFRQHRGEHDGVTTVTATDADLPAQTLTYYSITGGVDSGLFTIAAVSGVSRSFSTQL